MTGPEAAALFTVQLCLILLTCYAVGQLVKRIGQPPVVGEMIAGVCLGPSLLGHFWPGLQASIFPGSGPTMAILYTLSQLGLVLYMFSVGLRFDLSSVRRNASTATTVSSAGLVVPLVLGALLAFFLVRDPGTFFTADVETWQAALFLGAAIATTAFPMLARIISERGLTGHRLGTLALASGASTDAVSWILLAIVVAVFHDDPRVALVAIVGGVLYTVLLLSVGRRLMARWLSRRVTTNGGVTPAAFTIVIVLVLAAGWYTNAVGIHSIFGGFILGAAMPRGPLATALLARIEPLVKTLLLPLFFVYSGLNTQLGLLDSPTLWLVTIAIILASVIGKGGACYAAARSQGLSHYESWAVGSLMNARGLIELILLNIGLQAGLITPTLFSILVLMAVVTTLMASPAFDIAASRGNLLTADRPSTSPPNHVRKPRAISWIAGARRVER